MVAKAVVISLAVLIAVEMIGIMVVTAVWQPFSETEKKPSPPVS